jgi:hypothetical protein
MLHDKVLRGSRVQEVELLELAPKADRLPFAMTFTGFITDWCSGCYDCHRVLLKYALGPPEPLWILLDLA